MVSLSLFIITITIIVAMFISHFYHDAQQNEAQVFHEHHHGNDDHHAHSHEHTHSHEHEEQFSPVIDNDNMHYGQGEAGTHAPGISQNEC